MFTKFLFKYRVLILSFLILLLMSLTLVAVVEPNVGHGFPRDYGVRAVMMKAKIILEYYVTNEEKLPTDEEFVNSLSNLDKKHECSVGNYVCLFTIKGNNLLDIEGESCDDSSWKGKGDNECFYRYEGWQEDNSFKLWARRFGDETLFMYDSKTDTLYQCDINDTNLCNVDDYFKN